MMWSLWIRNATPKKQAAGVRSERTRDTNWTVHSKWVYDVVSSYSCAHVVRQFMQKKCRRHCFAVVVLRWVQTETVFAAWRILMQNANQYGILRTSLSHPANGIPSAIDCLFVALDPFGCWGLIDDSTDAWIYEEKAKPMSLDFEQNQMWSFCQFGLARNDWIFSSIERPNYCKWICIQSNCVCGIKLSHFCSNSCTARRRQTLKRSISSSVKDFGCGIFSVFSSSPNWRTEERMSLNWRNLTFRCKNDSFLLSSCARRRTRMCGGWRPLKWERNEKRENGETMPVRRDEASQQKEN